MNKISFIKQFENFSFLIKFFFKAKLKEERDAKRSLLDDRHYHIFQIVSDRLSLEKSEVEDSAIEGNQVIT